LIFDTHSGKISANMKMMKHVLVLMLMLGAAMATQAQKKESEAAIVKFSIADDGNLKIGQTVKFQIEATPKEGWHVYSALPSEEGAYMPAALGWELDSRGFTASDKLLEEGAMTSSLDDIMGGTVRYYKAKVLFSQEIKLTEQEVILVGFFDYMACNEEKCIPLTAEFKLEATAKE
jgi:DsbC/DsbD-like thiol-disulfide interchange protein